MSTTTVNCSTSTNNANIKHWLQKKYPNLIEKFTDENIKNAVLQLPEYMRDSNGEYSASEQSLLTPFGGRSDLEKIKDFITKMF